MFVAEIRGTRRRFYPGHVPRWIAALLDVVAVVAFVALGRSSHSEALSLAGLLTTSAPFLIALALVWVVLLALRRDPASLPAGVAVWLGTWGLGMVMRATVFSAGTAVAFVVVAAVSLGVTLIGWRLVVWAGSRASLGRRGRAGTPAERG